MFHRLEQEQIEDDQQGARNQMHEEDAKQIVAAEVQVFADVLIDPGGRGDVANGDGFIVEFGVDQGVRSERRIWRKKEKTLS